MISTHKITHNTHTHIHTMVQLIFTMPDLALVLHKAGIHYLLQLYPLCGITTMTGNKPEFIL